MKKYPLKEKGNGILGIQLKCPKHDWQRTIHIKNGIGCSYCYGNKKQLPTLIKTRDMTHQQPSSKEWEKELDRRWPAFEVEGDHFQFSEGLVAFDREDIKSFIQSLLTSHSQAIRERVAWYIGQTLNVYGAEHVVVGISTMVYDEDCEGEPEWKITNEIQEVAIAIKYPHTTYQKPCWLKVSELEKALALLNDNK